MIMPQEFQVLRCFNCETFQVSQVKKSPKWVCKICQEKQTTKHVYNSGSGAQCRKVVQDLNWKRMELSNAKEEELSKRDMVENTLKRQDEIIQDGFYDGVQPCLSSASGSRWTAFLPPSTTRPRLEEEEEEVDKMFEGFEEPLAKRLRKQGLEIFKASENFKPVVVSDKDISTNDPKSLTHVQPTQSKWSKFVS